jgi:hypothetical protein
MNPLTKPTHTRNGPLVKDTVKDTVKTGLTFAAFPKIHLNTSKSTFMKVVHLIEGRNFRVEWHFKFWVEIGEKLDGLAVPPVFQNRPTVNVGTTFPQNPLTKTLDGLYESCRG